MTAIARLAIACTRLLVPAALLGPLVLAGCTWDDVFADPSEQPTVAAQTGDALAVVESQNEGIGEGVGFAVNSFLWRAALETMSIMPLHAEDPYGGVIETDWHRMPETPDERIKVRVYILSRDLRTDSVRVDLQRQVRHPGGPWRDAAVDPETEPALETAILARARQMRIAMDRTR